MIRLLKLVARLFGFTILAAIMVLLITVLVTVLDSQVTQSYLGTQLECEANWEALDACFKALFREGMSQEQVYEILLELDPNLEATLGKEISCTIVDCSEIIEPFRDMVGSAFKHILRPLTRT